ncbi:uncharacterized protein LOC143580752 [Bidens hawaiensis]|uniref:uncharacterized protein LOC143580752 n=1 Tax=Bidens hawaiensis TaxID=980011 RepID=UPI00404B5BF7
MNLLSLNVRGMGVEGKSDWCRSLRKENEVNFFLIQESLCAGIEVSKIEKFWGKGNFGYEVVEPTGRSGGLFTAWDSNMFTMCSSIKNRNFLLIIGTLKVEFGLKGGNFSYAVGNKLRRIDRFLVCDNFVNKWPTSIYRILLRGKSDHSSILLKTFSCNYGPKPFRFFNSWMDREDFESVVLKVVKEFSYQGPPDIGLMLKFRCLRRALSAWRNECEAKEKEEKNIIKDDLVHLEKELEVRDLVEEELWALEEGKRRISHLETFRLRDLKQRARNLWAMEGDANSKFFHGLINRRRASNFIRGSI